MTHGMASGHFARYDARLASRQGANSKMNTPVAISRRDRLRSLVGTIAAMGAVTLVYAITFPLFALVLDQQGVSKTLIGFSTMAQASAVLIIAPLAPRLLQRYPAARLMQVATLGSAAMLVLAGLLPNVWFWIPLRVLLGAFNSMLWIASEALINELAEEHRRGRVIGIYTAVGSAGLALGPLTLVLTGSVGMLPFVAAAGLILLAAIPLFMVPSLKLDQHAEGAATGLWKIFWLAPTVMLANVVYAAVAESVITFFPLFGMAMGATEDFSLTLMTVLGLGSMLLIMPLMSLADRFNRMGLLVMSIALTMLCLALMPRVMSHDSLALGFVFVFGGVEGMIYALGVVLIGQQFRGAQLAAASTAFTACWSIGTIFGPLAVGVGMDAFGSQHMPLILLALFGLYILLPLRAWWRESRFSLRRTG